MSSLQGVAYSPPSVRSAASLGTPARIYLAAVAVAAAVVTAPFLSRLDDPAAGWSAFAVLAAAAAAAQLLEIRIGRAQPYHATGPFLVAAALLLRPELLPLVALAQHAPGWLRLRYPWHVQAFNTCNYTLATMAAWGGATLVGEASPFGSLANGAAAGGAACVVFVLSSHALLAAMLTLTRGRSLRASKLFTAEQLSTDLVLAALGVAVAGLWAVNVWLIPFVLAPLALIHRSLAVPHLEEQARVDPKTGLFNARHFGAALTDELSRATRFGRPLSLVMADLDLLREINNTHGHLAGDAVLKGVAQIFRAQLRHYDVPARFGGEEFALILPETGPEQALEIAERIRRAVAASLFATPVGETVRATVSLGVATFPVDGGDATELIHHADLAVYRAKLQGRNRVLLASSEPWLAAASGRPRLAELPPAEPAHDAPLRPARPVVPHAERRSARPERPPRLALDLPSRLALLVGSALTVGVAAGVLPFVLAGWPELAGLAALVVLVAAGQAVALEFEHSTISVNAVCAVAGACLFGPRAALPLALAVAAVDWSARRSPLHHLLLNVGAGTLAALAGSGAAALVATFQPAQAPDTPFTIAQGLAAGLAYFGASSLLLATAHAAQSGGSPRRAWIERFARLAPHYVVYGVLGGATVLGYQALGVWGLAVFAAPLLAIRTTQEAYLRQARRTAEQLRQAAETIRSQNVSLDEANRLLKERSTAAMERLSAMVDVRDAYTAGHARRVHELALAIGRELSLSPEELDVVGHAALFHDIGKLGVPDAILLKPGALDDDEWGLMREHAAEGARIIDRLGFLADAVPAIRHHHERFDGSGYPDGLAGAEIPLGARIVHVADALDSMLTTRTYSRARPADDALAELGRLAGTQFCPRCVRAAERVAPALLGCAAASR